MAAEESPQGRELREEELQSASGVVWPPTSGDDVRVMWAEQSLWPTGASLPSIFQPRNGPCGLLASVSAMACAAVLCSQQEDAVLKAWLLRPTDAQKTSAYVTAIANALVRAQCAEGEPLALRAPAELRVAGLKGGDEKVNVRVVVPVDAGLGMYATFSRESMMVLECKTPAQVEQALLRHADSFLREGGLLLLLYSLCLTANPAQLQQDLQYGTLIADEYGFCTQGLVNLVLSGEAVSA